MKKIANGIVRGKYVVFALWTVLLVGAILLLPHVGVNYSLTDYLPSDTPTKLGLDIMEKEFGLTGNLRVTLTGVDKEAAETMKTHLSALEHVAVVQFDTEDENYFKDNKATYLLLIEGDDRSEEAVSVIEAVREEVREFEVTLGGTAVSAQKQKEALSEQMVFLLIVCVLMAYLILIFTTRSFLEPLLFLVTAGVAVVINLGTNAIFGEISYITNSVAAILQLALSMDYSIMLLHAFHKARREEPDRKKAMAAAIADCIKPVSASALTTMAGLLALLFMSFTIGFDIGMVLMKGILISGLVANTLFPCVVLLFGPVLDKAKIRWGRKKDEDGAADKGLHPLAAFAKKTHLVLVPLALILVIAAAFLQNGRYTFSDSSAVDTKDNSSTLILLYKNDPTTPAKQAALREKLEVYRLKNGSPVLVDYSSYETTVLEEYDADKLAGKTGLSEAAARELLAFYHLTTTPEALSLTPAEFLSFVNTLAEEDGRVSAILGEETVASLAQVEEHLTLLEKEYTEEELYTLLAGMIPEDSLPEGLTFEPLYVEQLFGMYHYGLLEKDEVDFRVMLAFLLAESEENPLLQAILPADQLTMLKLFNLLLNSFMSRAEKTYDAAGFLAAVNKAGAALTLEQAEALYRELGGEGGELPYLTTAYRAVEKGLVDGEAAASIEKDYGIYEKAAAEYGYELFLPAALDIVYRMLGSEVEVDLPAEAVWQLYILYFNKQGLLSKEPVKGGELLTFADALISSNPGLGELLPVGLGDTLSRLTAFYVVFSGEETYPYPVMAEKLEELTAGFSGELALPELDEELVAAVYAMKFAGGEKAEVPPAAARELLTFVNDRLEGEGPIASLVDGGMRETLDGLLAQMVDAEELFVGNNYSRALLNVSLAADEEGSYEFVTDLNAYVAEIFGEEAVVTGVLSSAYDLKESFSSDKVLINLFTVISIFLIVLLIFRSLSVPMLLVLIIQGAIWIFLSVFALADIPIFFMSYIVASCILMGATIDYGILISSHYVALRREADRLSALSGALRAALPTVVSSGSVLMCCGFAVMLISDQVSISTVGLLLGIGTFTAVLMVLFVLPALLYFLDRFVMKTTWRPKKKEKHQ